MSAPRSAPSAAAFSDLETFASVTGAGLFRVDEQRNVVEVSPEVERITGFSRDEVLGRSCLDLVRCQQCLKGCGIFERGEVRNAELTLFRKDGTEIQVIKSGQVIRDADGEIAGAIEAIRPVDGGEAAAHVARAAADVGRLLAGLGRMVLGADRDLRIMWASRELEDLLGYPQEVLVGMHLRALFGNELFGADAPLTVAVLERERREGWRAELQKADETRVPVSITLGPGPEGTSCAGAAPEVVVLIRPEEVEATRSGHLTFHGILARSRAMQEIFRLVDLLQTNDAPVLISGESGTGKELVARAIHETSHRRDRPFVAVNCAAIPRELMESELFGHAKGAFTGAIRDRPGRFEAADGGTLFLDEIGDLPLELQGKLLRAIQQQSFERVGENRTRTVDVRVVAATNRELARAVTEGDFREDLYYRLRVIPIRVPPLRERPEDVPLLANHFLSRIGQRYQRSLRLSPATSRTLIAYDWPGNVRQLENVMEYAVAVCEGQTVHLPDLPEELRQDPLVDAGRLGATDTPVGRTPVPTAPRPTEATPEDSPHPLGDAGLQTPSTRVPSTPARTGPALSPSAAEEAALILETLRAHRFRKAETAEALGMSRTTLWRKMREYGL